eukprot:UN03258
MTALFIELIFWEKSLVKGNKRRFPPMGATPNLGGGKKLMHSDYTSMFMSPKLSGFGGFPESSLNDVELIED